MKKNASGYDIIDLDIIDLGVRGEGVAVCKEDKKSRTIFIPYALPGDRIQALVDGDRGKILQILVPSPARQASFCQHYTICGSCAVQGIEESSYQKWKRGIVVEALRKVRIDTKVSSLVNAHGEGRRRATFHARSVLDVKGENRIDVGFMRAGCHDLVDLKECPVLAPSMVGALSAARYIAKIIAKPSRPLDILVTAHEEGLDFDIRGSEVLSPLSHQSLVLLAQREDWARISNHGSIIIERRSPYIKIGQSRVRFPPGSFLQATQAGEAIIADYIRSEIGRVQRVADLFCGIGTFSLPIAIQANVDAFDNSEASIASLLRAAKETQGLKSVSALARDLFRRPLSIQEINSYDVVVLDPPRSGASIQMEILASSRVPKIISISCAAGTFARDAAILQKGGYHLNSVIPIDQFRHSAHVEIIGIFMRPETRAKKSRLLG
jgi:23S rRNA (uracil1939-C5)-methyltransferase